MAYAEYIGVMMEQLIKKIDDHEIKTYADAFEIAHVCTKLLASDNKNDEDKARKIVIHLLDSWEFLDDNYKRIWKEIIESLGFYPYLNNIGVVGDESLSDEIRSNYYRSDNIPNIFMHREQRVLDSYLKMGKNVVASAPTSFGKSLLIEEIVASKKYRNIIIIQPTLALLDETRIKLKKYGNDYKVIVRTSQAPSEEKGNLFLLTAERVMEYDSFPKIDFLILDEFYKLSLKRSDDRASILNNAFLKIVNRDHCNFYLLGPNIDGITDEFADKYNAVFYKSSYSLVDCNVVDYSNRIPVGLSKRKTDEEKLPILFELLEELGGEQTLIYCSTPARARRFAKAYCDYLREKKTKEIESVPLIEWIEKQFTPDWSLAKELRYGIAFHDGSLQKHIGASIIKYFNQNRLRCIFCTSTIIEGVNTSAKNVVLFDGEKGGKLIDYFDYCNIRGRSGRLMEHYVGKIYNFVVPPEPVTVDVDIPFIEQNENTLIDEVLVNIPKDDVKPSVKDRYDSIHLTKPDLLEIIKRNGTSIDGQMNIYYALRRDIRSSAYSNIAWQQIPNWVKMEYVLNLANNNTFSFDKHGVVSVKQLVHYLDIYRQHKSIVPIITELYNDKKSKCKQEPSEEQLQSYKDWAIETAFHIYRHWFQFTVPKAFRVVDSLQRYVCQEAGLKAGEYSYFVKMLENDFLDERLAILSELGIPNETIRRIEKHIPKEVNEEEMILFIKEHMSKIERHLLPYERERLHFCL